MQFKSLVLEAFSKYLDLFEKRFHKSDFVQPVTQKYIGDSYSKGYVLGLIQEAVGIDFSLVNLIRLVERSTVTLRIWEEVLEQYTDKESFEIYVTHVDSEATVAVDAPYKIKSRFTYFVGYVIHHCLNILVDNYQQSFPKDSINTQILYDKYLTHDKIDEIAPNTDRLYEAIRQIDYEVFREESSNLRNRKHHQDGPTIFTGSSGQVLEYHDEDGKKKYYKVSVKEPVSLTEIAEALEKELVICKDAYKELKEFVDSSFKIFQEYKTG